MRPPNVESNLYQYHLSQLQKEKYVTKDSGRYTVGQKGLAYADSHSSVLKKARPQPKLITVSFVTNSNNEVLITPRKRQPFIKDYHLPSGKIHIGEAYKSAIARELKEKIGIDSNIFDNKNFGIAHITIVKNSQTISDYYALLGHVTLNATPAFNDSMFVSFNNLNKYNLMPGITELLSAFKNKTPFYESIIKI